MRTRPYRRPARSRSRSSSQLDWNSDGPLQLRQRLHFRCRRQRRPSQTREEHCSQVGSCDECLPSRWVCSNTYSGATSCCCCLSCQESTRSTVIGLGCEWQRYYTRVSKTAELRQMIGHLSLAVHEEADPRQLHHWNGYETDPICSREEQSKQTKQQQNRTWMENQPTETHLFAGGFLSLITGLNRKRCLPTAVRWTRRGTER